MSEPGARRRSPNRLSPVLVAGEASTAGRFVLATGMAPAVPRTLRCSVLGAVRPRRPNWMGSPGRAHADDHAGSGRLVARSEGRSQAWTVR
jgi:hypothetical protein